MDKGRDLSRSSATISAQESTRTRAQPVQAQRHPGQQAAQFYDGRYIFDGEVKPASAAGARCTNSWAAL
ncbi:MAG: hypothetical protein H6661_02100 [Ardenticatenaceae bacterium]|nr:hypothetical protein [Ardenticatenaceae bacterium]